MVDRSAPALPAGQMKTYALAAPLPTHFRPVTCEEFGCWAWRNGWETRVPVGSEMAEEARATRSLGYHFVETREGDKAVFTFPPGQPCFRAANHHLPLEREPLYLVRDGDWRGNPRGTPTRRHARPEDWVDDFATHQQQLSDRLKEG